MPWVESISDPRSRCKAVTRLAAVCIEQTPAALAAYVQGAAFLNAQQEQQLQAEGINNPLRQQTRLPHRAFLPKLAIAKAPSLLNSPP